MRIELEDDDYFTGPPLTPEMVIRAETELGYVLPEAYVDVLRERNGGCPRSACFPTPFPTSWAPDRIKISAILGIGGRIAVDESKDQIAEWGYPDIGLVVCATPSAGHDTVMLDYSECGARGEPAVVYIDEDRIPRRLAGSFAGFLTGLRVCHEVDDVRRAPVLRRLSRRAIRRDPRGWQTYPATARSADGAAGQYADGQVRRLPHTGAAGPEPVREAREVRGRRRAERGCRAVDGHRAGNRRAAADQSGPGRGRHLECLARGGGWPVGSTGYAGMIVKRLGPGAWRLECSDGVGGSDFTDLVVEVRLSPAPNADSTAHGK